MSQTKPTPIVSPIAALLRSRKTMTALIGALISLLVPFAPGLEAQRENLLTVGLILSGVLAATLTHSIAVEDAAEKSAPALMPIGSAETVNVQPPADTSTPPRG
jgi:hypothetical protein